jgi:hypothetical protein
VLPERIGRKWLLRRGWGQGLTNARLRLAGDHHGRRERWRRAIAEARESAACFAARKEPDRDELGALVLAVVHAATAAELARATFAREQGP